MTLNSYDTSSALVFNNHCTLLSYKDSWHRVMGRPSAWQHLMGWGAPCTWRVHHSQWYYPPSSPSILDCPSVMAANRHELLVHEDRDFHQDLEVVGTPISSTLPPTGACNTVVQPIFFSELLHVLFAPVACQGYIMQSSLSPVFEYFDFENHCYVPSY